MSTTLVHVELRVGETMRIGDTLITLSQKSGQRARLAICADPSTNIVRPRGRNTTGAQECASSPEEAANGKHPV
ncbi:hypothetical protein [Variovorax paradoxus]|jgi:hypothetical protein|uniref:hypothetical protein n=1 Tax=Variovorax paradoxus TaxID=34073 RepID=UPI003D65A042